MMMLFNLISLNLPNYILLLMRAGWPNINQVKGIAYFIEKK